MVQLSNPDKDHRYMATSDLLAALQNPDWKQAGYSDDSSQVCEKVVKQLDDSSGDISALAVKWCSSRRSCAHHRFASQPHFMS